MQQSNSVTVLVATLTLAVLAMLGIILVLVFPGGSRPATSPQVQAAVQADRGQVQPAYRPDPPEQPTGRAPVPNDFRPQLEDSQAEKIKNLVALLDSERELRFRNMLTNPRTTEASLRGLQDFWPTISASDFDVGMVGRLPQFAGGSHPVEVFQITGPNEILASSVGGITYAVRGQLRRSEGGTLFKIRGISTAGHVDGRTGNMPQVLEVVGTTRYTTVTGATKTVFVVEPLDSAVQIAAEKVVLETYRKHIEDYLAEKKVRDDAAAKAAAERREIAEFEAKQAAKDAERRKAEAKRKAEEEAKAEAIAKAENAAGVLLQFAERLRADGKPDLARKRLEQILEEYPKTKAAAEAKRLLGK